MHIDYSREEAAIELERRIGAARTRHERLHRSGSKEEARAAHAELGMLLMQRLNAQHVEPNE